MESKIVTVENQIYVLIIKQSTIILMFKMHCNMLGTRILIRQNLFFYHTDQTLYMVAPIRPYFLHDPILQIHKFGRTYVVYKVFFKLKIYTNCSILLFIDREILFINVN